MNIVDKLLAPIRNAYPATEVRLKLYFTYPGIGEEIYKDARVNPEKFKSLEYTETTFTAIVESWNGVKDIGLAYLGGKNTWRSKSRFDAQPLIEQMKMLSPIFRVDTSVTFEAKEMAEETYRLTLSELGPYEGQKIEGNTVTVTSDRWTTGVDWFESVMHSAKCKLLGIEIKKPRGYRAR